MTGAGHARNSNTRVAGPRLAQTTEFRENSSKTPERLCLKLSKFERPRSREELRQSLDLSSMDLMNGLQSLQKRYLLAKIKEDRVLFKLSPVFRKYLISCCQE